jgi:hypothetical protein
VVDGGGGQDEADADGQVEVAVLVTVMYEVLNTGVSLWTRLEESHVPLDVKILWGNLTTSWHAPGADVVAGGVVVVRIVVGVGVVGRAVVIVAMQEQALEMAGAETL